MGSSASEQATFRKSGSMHGHASLLCVAMGVLLALLLAATGCSGDASRFTGVWDLEESKSPDAAANLSSEDIASMRELGLASYLIVDADNSLTLVSFDRALHGSWKITGDSKANATLDGQSADITLEDDLLKLTQGDAELTFSRGDEESQAEADARVTADGSAQERREEQQSHPEGDATGAKAGLSDMIVRGALLEKPVVLADTDVCRLVVDGTGVDKWGDPGYNLQIENKTARAIDVWTKDAFTVQDKSVRAYLFETVPANGSITAFIQLDTDDLGAASASALVDVKGTLLVDDDAGITIARYSLAL